MEVAVVVYSNASRTYLVDVPDKLANATGTELLGAVMVSDKSRWRWKPDWDEEADFDGVTDPAAIYKLDAAGRCEVDPAWDIVDEHGH